MAIKTFEDYEEIADWVENNLFGNRKVEGLTSAVPLTSTQQAIRSIAIEIILKWEERKDNEKLPKVQKSPHLPPHRGKNKLR